MKCVRCLFFFMMITHFLVAQDSVLHQSIDRKVNLLVQDSSKASWQYFINFQIGSLVGCKSCSGGKQITFTTSIVQGAAFRERLRLGIGSGLDSYYGWQVVPLFGSVSWDMIRGERKNAVVIQLDYGGAFPRMNEELREYGYTKVSAGRMVNTQIGYRIQYHDLKLSLMAGYKYQRLQTQYEYPTVIPSFSSFWRPGVPGRTTVSETLTRFAVTMGIGWH